MKMVSGPLGQPLTTCQELDDEGDITTTLHLGESPNAKSQRLSNPTTETVLSNKIGIE